MNKKQRPFVLHELHIQNNINEADQLLNDLINNFGLNNENQINSEKENIVLKFKNGIKHLKKQFSNLLSLIIANNYSETDIKSKLKYYDFNTDFHSYILEFFVDSKEANKIIYVDKLDENFK
jgi:ribosomal protein L30E